MTTEPQPAEPATPTAIDSAEQKAIVKRFILAHLTQHDEACDLFFSHRIRYEFPAVDGENITRVINELVRNGELKFTRFEAVDLSRINFLAIA
jgi:hypothetical protein